jgi:hypothetical protein
VRDRFDFEVFCPSTVEYDRGANAHGMNDLCNLDRRPLLAYTQYVFAVISPNRVLIVLAWEKLGLLLFRFAQ